MKTTLHNSKAGAPSRTEQLSTETGSVGTKQIKPFVNFEQRDQNRQLPTARVLELLKSSMPGQFELAEVVGKWIWIQFAEAPAEKIRADLSQLGFHWNSKRQAWQHPCGQFSAGSPNEPREKYASYFPADTHAAA